MVSDISTANTVFDKGLAMSVWGLYDDPAPDSWRDAKTARTAGDHFIACLKPINLFVGFFARFVSRRVFGPSF